MQNPKLPNHCPQQLFASSKEYVNFHSQGKSGKACVTALRGLEDSQGLQLFGMAKVSMWKLGYWMDR